MKINNFRVDLTDILVNTKPLQQDVLDGFSVSASSKFYLGYADTKITFFAINYIVCGVNWPMSGWNKTLFSVPVSRNLHQSIVSQTLPLMRFFLAKVSVTSPRKIMYSYNQNKFIGSSIKNKIKLNFEKSLTGCREMVFSVFVSANISAWSPVLPI